MIIKSPNDPLAAIKSAKIKEFLDFAKELNTYIKLGFGYRKDLVNVDKNSTTISVNIRKIQLYLRYKPKNYPPNCLVVARIAFAEKRNGRGRDFFNFLVGVSDRYDLEYVAIESANESSGAFARKYGFSQLSEDDNRTFSCSVPSLRRTISCDIVRPDFECASTSERK